MKPINVSSIKEENDRQAQIMFKIPAHAKFVHPILFIILHTNLVFFGPYLPIANAHSIDFVFFLQPILQISTPSVWNSLFAILSPHILLP